MGRTAEIAFGLFDTTARQDSQLQFGAPVQSFCHLEELGSQARVVPPLVATLEEDYFLLDGSFQPFPNQPDPQGWGLWSGQMSGADGAFTTPLQLTISFARLHSSVGLTLYFDLHTGDCPNQIRARWYDHQGSLLATGLFGGEGSRWILDKKVEGYGKIILEFLGTRCPYRYLKLSGIQYGADYRFTGEQLLGAQITEEADPLSARLPVGVLEFSLHNHQGGFSLLNPQGILGLLQQRQRLDVLQQGEGGAQPMGSFYLHSWADDGDGALRLTAQDAIGLLEEGQFLGGIYQERWGRQLLEEILAQAGVDYEIDPQLPDLALSGWLPVCSHREALRQVAFAMGAVVRSTRQGGIRLEPPPQRPAVLIPSSRKLLGQQTTLRDQVTGVDLTAYSYHPGQEQRELFREWLTPGQHRVLLARPAGGFTASGGQLVAQGSNFAEIQVTTPGEVVLTGWEYTVSKRVLACRSPQPHPPLRERTLRIEDATLLAKDQPQAAAQRVLSYYANRVQSQFTMLPGSEEVGWLAMVQTPGEYQLRGQLERMVIDLGRGFLTQVQLYGSPIPTIQQDYLGEAYTGEEVGVI